MAERVKKCWIVELFTISRGWEPCYQSEVNYSREWAEENAKTLKDRYPGSRYRVAQYRQMPKKVKNG